MVLKIAWVIHEFFEGDFFFPHNSVRCNYLGDSFAGEKCLQCNQTADYYSAF